MKRDRGRCGAWVGVVAGIALAIAPAHGLAQAYPTKPLRLVVPAAPGGPSDIQGRMIGHKLAEALGQQVVIDNRAGASGNIGVEIVARAPPDGHTLVVATVGMIAVNPHLYRLPYDVMRDLAPITLVSESPAVLIVHPSLPVRSVSDLVGLARSRPGQITFGSSGSGGLGHMCGELFKLLAKVDLVHVPYKGSAPALTDLVGGHIGVLFNNMISTTPLARSGKVRALAVTTAKRSPVLPELPTMAEAGVAGYENNSWTGLFTSGGTPPEIVRRLHAETVRILALPDVRERHAAVGADIVGNTPEQFATYIREESEKLGRMVKAARIRVD